MMDVSIEVVRQAALRAKTKVLAAGIIAEEVDLVASAMAALELIGNGSSASDGQNKPGGTAAFTETFAEWAAHFSIETNYDKFLAVGVYLRDQKQLLSINIDTVAQMFDKARWVKPKNLADTFAKAAQKRYFTEAEGEESAGPRAWQVTRTGYEYFQNLHKED